VQQGNAKLMADYSPGLFRRHLRGEAAPLLDGEGEGLASYEHEGR
jgi:hypothetical protein